MKTREEFIQERKAKRQLADQAFLAKIRNQKSPNQERLLSKLGMRLKVNKPE